MVDEIYGTIMQKLTIGTENKNLRYIQNEIFRAAKEDIIADREAAKTRSSQEADRLFSEDSHQNIRYHSGSTENLESRLNAIAKKMYPQDIDDRKRKDFVEGIKKELTQDDSVYSQVKKDLADRRVRGVNKTIIEGVATIVKNFFLMPQRILAALDNKKGVKAALNRLDSSSRDSYTKLVEEIPIIGMYNVYSTNDINSIVNHREVLNKKKLYESRKIYRR